MNMGAEVIKAITSYVSSTSDSCNPIKVLSNTKALQLLQNSDGSISGLLCEQTNFTSKEASRITITSKAVVLATGGFSANRGLLHKYAPHLPDDLPTTNGFAIFFLHSFHRPFATGDGLSLAESVGAQMVHLDKVQVHPTGFIDPSQPTNPVKWLAPEAFRGSGALLLDSNGHRFVNELGYRDHVTAHIFKHGAKYGDDPNGNTFAWLVMNKAAAALFPIPDIYVVKGFVTTFPNSAAMADALHFDKDSVRSELLRYAESARAGTDQFGKTVFPVTFSPDEELYVMAVTPSSHYTMGGLKINKQANVLDKSGNPIVGLYGAGEVTGGIHGNNRLAGNGLLDNLVFGRIAGQDAASLSKSKPCL